MAEENNGAAKGQQIQLRIRSYAEAYATPPRRMGVKLIVVGESMDGTTMFRVGDVDMSVDGGMQDAWPMVMAHLEQRLRELKLLPPKSGIEIVKPGPVVPPVVLDILARDKLRNGR